MQRFAWLTVVLFLLVNVGLLIQRRSLEAEVTRLRGMGQTPDSRSKYSSEEDFLLASNVRFPSVLAAAKPAGAVEIFLIGSVDDCTNSIEDEVSKLNEIVLAKPKKVLAVRGFFVNEGRAESVGKIVQGLSPQPLFPVIVQNVLLQLREATTPLVIVVRSEDGKIIDAHKPIPEDLVKRDAFYARLVAYLELT